MTHDSGSDSGSIVLLGIGFLGVCLLALAVITDVSAAFIQQRSLQSQADSIALACVQVIDLEEYYRSGATESTKLNSAHIQVLARKHLSVTKDSEDITMTIRAADRQAEVVLQRPLRLTFFDSLPFDPITVSASARLDYRDS